MKELREFLAEEKAQGEWGSVYLLLVLIIAVLVLIAIIKPMFVQSRELVAQTEESLR